MLGSPKLRKETRVTGAGALALDPDAALVDREARFCGFVASHRERAVRLAWRLVGGDGAAAEDVAQDAFLRAYKALPRFREESSLSTWFYRILVRQAQSYRRWRAVREVWTPTPFSEADAAAPGVVADPVLRRRIRRALEQLTRKQREAFVLVHLEQFTVREAAQILRMPDGTLKSHLHRALAKLREQLADLNDAERGVDR
jgi:RNA polymerase sigma-70 factor (ECF subfamily)